MAAAGLAGCLLAGCAGVAPPSDADERVKVVAGFYPLAYVAEQVGGNRVSVTSLAQPGAEPHDMELTPQQVAQIADADLVLYLKGFQPAVDAAVAQEAGDRAVDVAQGIPPVPTDATLTLSAGAPPSGSDHAHEADPHVWLDPSNMIRIAGTVGSRLAADDPSGAPAYDRNRRRLAGELSSLDRRWARGTRSCASRDLVVSHAAFAYLAARYRFRQVAISGLTPDEEPDPATVAQLTDFVRSSGARTVYAETLVDPKVAQTIAAEAGVATGVLDPIEGVPEGSVDDYVSLMAANLEAVRDGQPCR